VKGRVERGRPRIRISRRGDRGTCPGEGSTALVDVLGRSVGVLDAGVGEERDVLRLGRYRDFGRCAQSDESVSRRHD
jgi:hypothetical protein